MNEIRINVDTEFGFHPPKIVIQENGKTLLDMPADELVGWIKLARRHLEQNNEGDRPCEDGDRSSDSLPAAGG